MPLSDVWPFIKDPLKDAYNKLRGNPQVQKFGEDAMTVAEYVGSKMPEQRPMMPQMDPNNPEDVYKAAKLGMSVDELNNIARQAEEAALNYGPNAMGTIVGKGIKGLSTIEDIAKAEVKSRKAIPTLTEPPQKPYMSGHMAPTTIESAPGYNLKNTFPDDIYSSEGARLYGHGDNPYMDNESINVIQEMRGKPGKKVTIYRSVAKDVKGEINPGDWVSVSKQYAKQHGESNLGGKGKYKVVAKVVNARDIFTDGNSIHEWGYAPQEVTKDFLENQPYSYQSGLEQNKYAKMLLKEYAGEDIPMPSKSFPQPRIAEMRQQILKAEDFLDGPSMAQDFLDK